MNILSVYFDTSSNIFISKWEGLLKDNNGDESAGDFSIIHYAEKNLKLKIVSLVAANHIW